MIIFVNELNEGMVLLKDVYHQNKILVEEGTKLTNNIIEKLEKFDILEVEIEAEFADDEMKEIIEKEKMLKQAFKVDYERALESAKEVMVSLQKGEVKEEEIKEIINDTLGNIEIDSNILISLLDSKKGNDYIFQHSLNTVAISLLIGRALNYSEEKLMLLGKGALLHDVGMVNVEREILYKETELNESDVKGIQKHVQHAINMCKGVEDEVLEIIKYHHERVDGSGYPEGLKGDEIPEMAKIVAISDVYTALTEDRSHRIKYDYYDAMRIVMQSSVNLLDSEILKEFLKVNPIYPINSYVVLNDKKIGKVVKANENPFRPVVDIEQDGKMARIDLQDDIYLTRYIVGVKK